MTSGGPRPGAQLLVSLIPEERRGWPGPARAAAIEAARADPSRAHEHLLDAVYSALVAGEPRAANAILDEAVAAAPDEEPWRRRIAACRAWIWTVERNWYPGDIGAEVVEVATGPPYPQPAMGDMETTLLEACVTAGASVLSLRSLLENTVRASPQAAETFLGNIAQALGGLRAALEAAGVVGSVLWVDLALADALRRAGRVEDAETALAAVRQTHQLAREGGLDDRAGLAWSHVVEGDWYAAPGSTPEALGFELETHTHASPFADRRDDARAAEAYDRAAEALGDADAPRVRGALALRRAALAWHAQDHEAQLGELGTAAAQFARAGDAAGSWLAAVHRLVAEVAVGRVAQTRFAAGTAFDLTPRGQVAALVRWRDEAGSPSWTAGLGRLLQRVGAHWDRAGEYERAEVVYSMAVPLVGSSGAEVAATVLVELAEVDTRQRLVMRATTRLRQALTTLPPVADATGERLDWMRHVNVALEVTQAHMNESATAVGTSVGGLERAIAHARGLLELPGVPEPGSGGVLDATRLKALADARRGQTAEELLSDAEREITGRETEMLAAGAETARTVLALADAYLAFQRAGQAARAGALPTAARWYEQALGMAEALEGLAPHTEIGVLTVVILSAMDRFDEARVRLRDLVAAGKVGTGDLASVAVRARDYGKALELFGSGDLEQARSRPWFVVLDHAEAALGADDPDLAAALAGVAVADFEERFTRLHRDADRVLASDDVKVAALYLVAAQAEIARAERAAAACDSRAETAAHERGFRYSDRARSLALSALMADLAADADDALARGWRQAAAEWQSAYERLYRAYVVEAREEDVTRAISALSDAEGAITRLESELERRSPASVERRRRPEPPTALRHVQAALPEDAVLLEYQATERDLLIWAVTRRTVSHATGRIGSGVLARLVNAVHQGCANGDPGADAEELAELILAPVSSVLDGVGRVLVVPYGRLHGVAVHALPLAGAPLGATHVVSYLPAASLLAGTTVDEAVEATNPLVVGDPAFDTASHPELERLPGAAVEAAAVARTYGVQAWLDHDADERAIRAVISDRDLLHLAAHGRLDAIAPSASAIVLAGRDELTVSDLIGLRLHARLAVLSACDTGRGAAALGGDVVGLARGLAAAGALRSVVSLWPVDDAPACVTMALFHEALGTGGPAAALHAAQRAVRGLSGAEIMERYVALGGDPSSPPATRRRGASGVAASPLPFDPELADDLVDEEPSDALSGDLARVWAPFVLVGA